MVTRGVRQLLIGRPLHNQEAVHEKLPKWKALAIFSSDALSSVAYGPEEIMKVLAIPGLLAYGYMGPVAIGILILLAIITMSYVQVARANPGGGGSYSVAIHNLGELPALTAAASLFADYTLTVAVSVSAGTAAITSAFPMLLPYTVHMDLAVLFLILTLINLRGVRESSNVFVFPTYAFIIGILSLIVAGAYNAITNPAAPVLPPESLAMQQMDWSILFLSMRAFANGCSSMTGVEAISNGVPMFKKPEVHNAAVTTYWMSGILGAMFIGISFLIMHFHLLPLENITALSEVAESTFGRGPIFYYIDITTMLVLYLAANTAYNGLPPLLSILARDGYAPRYLGSRGERLGFSNGIVLLSVFAAILIVVFAGNVEQLISLYAIGVFLSFTIAQSGLVVHWFKEKSPGWQARAVLNGLGALVTAVVVLVIGITKFLYGAWIVIVFIPIMIGIFRAIKHHYNDMAEQLHLPLEEDNLSEAPIGENIVIVPISTPTRVVKDTLKYARLISDNVIALHISTEEEAECRVRAKWELWNPGVRLDSIYSPYRLLIAPLLDYIDALEKTKRPEDYITVLIPEFETKKWWHRLLHNQTGWVLRTLLILRKNVIVTTIPFHLKK